MKRKIQNEMNKIFENNVIGRQGNFYEIYDIGKKESIDSTSGHHKFM